MILNAQHYQKIDSREILIDITENELTNAVVLQNVPDNSTADIVPARIILKS